MDGGTRSGAAVAKIKTHGRNLNKETGINEEERFTQEEQGTMGRGRLPCGFYSDLGPSNLQAIITWTRGHSSPIDRGSLDLIRQVVLPVLLDDLGFGSWAGSGPWNVGNAPKSALHCL